MHAEVPQVAGRRPEAAPAPTEGTSASVPKATFVVPFDLDFYGSTRVSNARLERLLRVQRERGAQIRAVEWVRWRSGLPPDADRDGIQIRRIELIPPSRGVAARARFLAVLTRTVRSAILEGSPDGIVLYDEELMLASAGAKRRLGVPLFYDAGEDFVGLVAEERSFESRLYALQQRLLASRIDHVYTAVEAVAQRFRRLGCEATVLYNSRPSSEIRPYEIPRAEAKRRLGLPEDSLALGFLGSIHEGQGLGPCIEALRDLPADVRLVVVGNPLDELARVLEAAKVRGVADRVVGLPTLPRYRDVIPIASAFDVGLLTLAGQGPNYEQRLSTKLFDYMALGQPVLVSDFAEMRRFAVEEVGCALLTKPRDSASIRDAVLRLRADEGLRREMGRRAREAFDKEYAGEHQDARLRASHPFWR